MTTFLFAYRMPKDYTPGRPEAVAAWTAWFEGMGASVAGQGLPVLKSATLGDCGDSTRLGGYSLITADNLEAALVLRRAARPCRRGLLTDLRTEAAAGRALASPPNQPA